MSVESAIDSIKNEGVQIAFRVHGFPVALAITQIIMKRAQAKKLKVQPPEGFREETDPGYASLQEFEGDYLGDKPDASPEQIQKAWAREQKRLKGENSRYQTFVGRLKPKWLGSTRLFIPLDVNQTGTIEFVFTYSRRLPILFMTRATSATSTTLTLPGVHGNDSATYSGG